MTNYLQTANRIQRDSVYLHDSVYVHTKADTVYQERWHTRWRDRVTIRTDTVQVEVIKTETVRVRYVPKFYKWCTAIAALLLILLFIRIILRIKH